MNYKVEWLDEGVDSFTAIMEYNQEIGATSVNKKLAAALSSFIDNVSVFPKMGRKIRGIDGEFRNFVILNNYKVFFRIIDNDSTVTITKIWDNRQNPSVLDDWLDNLK